jgi:hypothetical protein
MASLVEGDAGDPTFEYSDALGPRTVTTLSNVVTLIGPKVPSTIQLRIYGGPLPDGSAAYIAEIDPLARGGHYVLFLSRKGWFATPILGAPLRRETIEGREILVTDTGFAVGGLATHGYALAGPQLFLQRTEFRERNLPRLPTGASLGPTTTLSVSDFATAIASTVASAGIVLDGAFYEDPTPDGPDWRTHPAKGGI